MTPGGENSTPQSSEAMASTQERDSAGVGMDTPASPADSNTSSAMAIDLTTPPSTPPSEEVPLLVLVEEDVDDPNSGPGDDFASHDHSLQLSYSNTKDDNKGGREEDSGGTTQMEENCSNELDDESSEQVPLLDNSSSKHSDSESVSTSQNGGNDDLFSPSSDIPDANNKLVMSIPNRSQGIQTLPSKQPLISHIATSHEQQPGSSSSSSIDIQDSTPPASPGTEDLKRRVTPQALSDGILSDEELGENTANYSYRVRQVAKVKQFFTTLQSFGNRMSSEVAEQVQELITALVVR